MMDSLPQSIGCLTSLTHLTIACDNLKQLPESIKHLTNLRRLNISGCPNLVKRCEQEVGEDWQLVSHIPNLISD